MEFYVKIIFYSILLAPQQFYFLKIKKNCPYLPTAYLPEKHVLFYSILLLP